MTEKQLWNSILQMAVTGKLVPQHPEDEPASALLARIEKEKAALIKEKKIKKEKNPTRIVRGENGGFFEVSLSGHSGRSEMGTGKWEMDGAIDISDQLPFEIPESWEWVRLGDYSSIARGGSPRPINEFLTEDENGINWIKIGDTEQGGKYIYSTKEKIKPEGVSKSRYVHSGDFLLTNSMSFGRPYILKTDGCIHDGWLVIGEFEKIFIDDFFYYLLSSKAMYDALSSMAAGTTVKNLKSDTVKALLVPIPPLDEQKRIVEKLGELAPLVSLYGEKERAVSEMDANFAGALKKSVLAAAVSGKLLAQDAADEPAAALLARIEAEKAALIKAKKLKKEKNPTRIVRGKNGGFFEVSLSGHSGRSEMGNGKWEIDGAIDISDQLPFEIPESWEWVRLGNIGDWASGATPSRTNPKYYGGKIPWLKTGDLNDGYIDSVPEFITELALEKTSVRLNPIGSVLIAMYGATIGKLGILNIEATTNQACCACIPFSRINKEYLFYFLMSHKVAFVKRGEGGAQPNISKEKIISTLMPLPPLAEQERIAARVREIFATLDELH